VVFRSTCAVGAMHRGIMELEAWSELEQCCFILFEVKNCDLLVVCPRQRCHADNFRTDHPLFLNFRDNFLCDAVFKARMIGCEPTGTVVRPWSLMTSRSSPRDSCEAGIVLRFLACNSRSKPAARHHPSVSINNHIIPHITHHTSHVCLAFKNHNLS
jgi:hypothetical protein